MVPGIPERGNHVAFKLSNLELRRAISLPFRGNERWIRLLQGGFLFSLMLLPLLAQGTQLWLYIPLALGALVVSTGYALRVMEQEVNAKPDALPRELPSMNNWGELFTSGLKALGLVSIYLGGFAALVFLIRLLTGLPLFELNHFEKSGEATQLITVMFMIVGSVLLVAYLPAMLVGFSKEKTFRSGFHGWTYLKVGFGSDRDSFYAMLWPWLLVHLDLLLIVTIVLFPPALFVTQVFWANLVAQAYRRATAPKQQPEKKEEK